MSKISLSFFKHFNDIDEKYLKMDLHIHSDWTDGKNSIEEIIKHSETLNIHTIALTDHIRSTSTYFPEYNKKIQELRKKTNINVLIGLETRIKNFKGDLDVKNDDKKLSEITIASVHRFPFANQLFSAEVFTKETAQAIELDLCIAGIKKGGFDVLGHAGGMCLKQFNEFSLEYFESIIIACKQNNIVFEINSNYHKDIYPQLKTILKKHNPLVIFGSDAHKKNNIAEWQSTNFYKDFANENN